MSRKIAQNNHTWGKKKSFWEFLTMTIYKGTGLFTGSRLIFSSTNLFYIYCWKQAQSERLDSPDYRSSLGHPICGQTVPTKLFPSPAELLKMHNGTSTVSLRACRRELKVYLCLMSSGSEIREGGREGERERGEGIIITNLFFMELVGYTWTSLCLLGHKHIHKLSQIRFI